MVKSNISSLGKKIREVEKDLTKELIKWKIKRDGLPPPDEETLEKGTEQIVDEAHSVVKKVWVQVRLQYILTNLNQPRKNF